MTGLTYSQPARELSSMAKKRAKPTQHSAIQRELKTPKYQMRVVEDKSKYKRKRDKVVQIEDFRKAA
ncbi:hypothetical protein FDP08_09265 [Marinobacter panjinensis]|uniref:Uncharacterized protein n=1 Tax=Marinobacter panjinensis TaxID=2576384 RepID=A0A4U6R5Q5_9GAMM|nr:hypothetical protein [Marinobacter panjinensis]MCR8916268.1 hypothetical protein [Marinobacter panjinensis]TKV68268.1 hypothetical protein FDP08_09265 [Marinobacter panjinensis]